MTALLCTLVLELSGLQSDGLVHNGGEVGEDVLCKGKLEIWVESITELLLPSSIIWEVATRIAREVEEFPLICLDRFASLNEVAKLSLHMVHARPRDIASAESSPEVIPGDDSPFSQ